MERHCMAFCDFHGESVVTIGHCFFKQRKQAAAKMYRNKHGISMHKTHGMFGKGRARYVKVETGWDRLRCCQDSLRTSLRMGGALTSRDQLSAPLRSFLRMITTHAGGLSSRNSRKHPEKHPSWVQHTAWTAELCGTGIIPLWRRLGRA